MHLGARLGSWRQGMRMYGFPSSGLMSESMLFCGRLAAILNGRVRSSFVYAHEDRHRVSLCSLFSCHAKSRDNVPSPLLPRRQHSMYPTKLPAAHQIPSGVTRPSVQRCQVLLSLPRASWPNGSQAWSPREQGVSSSGHVLGQC